MTYDSGLLLESLDYHRIVYGLLISTTQLPFGILAKGMHMPRLEKDSSVVRTHRDVDDTVAEAFHRSWRQCFLDFCLKACARVRQSEENESSKGYLHQFHIREEALPLIEKKLVMFVRPHGQKGASIRKQDATVGTTTHVSDEVGIWDA